MANCAYHDDFRLAMTGFASIARIVDNWDNQVINSVEAMQDIRDVVDTSPFAPLKFDTATMIVMDAFPGSRVIDY